MAHVRLEHVAHELEREKTQAYGHHQVDGCPTEVEADERSCRHKRVGKEVEVLEVEKCANAYYYTETGEARCQPLALTFDGITNTLAQQPERTGEQDQQNGHFYVYLRVEPVGTG